MFMIEKHSDSRHGPEGFDPGDHLCCIYQSDDEQRIFLKQYVKQGLSRTEKIVFIGDARKCEEIGKYLHDEGIALDHGVRSAQFVALTSENNLDMEGRFDLEARIDLLEGETRTALDQGYTGLRVIQEMTPGEGDCHFQQVMDFAARLDSFLANNKCLSICQFDSRKLDVKQVLAVLASYTRTVINIGAYTRSPSSSDNDSCSVKSINKKPEASAAESERSGDNRFRVAV